MKRLFTKYKSMILYLVFGVSSTLINWIAYAILESITNNIYVANILSWLITIIFTFITNKQMVFGSSNWKFSTLLPELLRFFLARMGTGVLEIVGVPLLLHIGVSGTLFGIQGLGVKCGITVIVIIVNYIFSKLFVFEKNRNDEKDWK